MVAMDQSGARCITEQSGMRVAAVADDARGVRGIIFAQAAGDLCAAGVHDIDHVAALEPAIYPGRAGGEQALALAKRMDRALVDHDAAARGEPACEPGLARARSLFRYEQAVAGRSSEGVIDPSAR